MYRDARKDDDEDKAGLVTCAVGNLVDDGTGVPPHSALALPWLNAYGDEATADEIKAEWLRIKRMPAGLKWTRYGGRLHLSDEAIDELVRAHLRADYAILCKHYPNLPTYPLDAQRAICSIAWACGSGFPPKWPHFSAAVVSEAWACEDCREMVAAGKGDDAFRDHSKACTSACANSVISTVGNPGVAPRNSANRVLLCAA